MNLYSIVQTYEDEEILLSVLPTKWTVRNGWVGAKNSVEGQDLCFWPKNFAGYRLLERSKKNPDVDVDENNLKQYRCKIKRSGFETYAEAARHLKAMETTPDTDEFDAPKAPAKAKGAADLFQSIQAQSSSAATEKVPARESLQIQPAPECENSKLNEIISFLQSFDKKVDTALTELQTLRGDVDQVRTLVCRASAKIDFLASNNATQNPSTSNQQVKLKKFSLSPVQSLKDLKTLEENCKNDEFVKSAVRSIGNHMGRNLQTGNGATVCLRVVDLLFSREFFTKCSWTGLSRTRTGDGSIVNKIAFQQYEGAINLFYQIVAYSDPIFPVEECNNFLRRCLQNSKQRFEEVKGIRNSASRKRRKQIQHDNGANDATGSTDDEGASVTEHNGNVSDANETGNVSIKVEELSLMGEEIIVEEYVL